MTLKVLHVIPSVSVADGGPSRAMALMEQGLSGAGVSVTTLTSDFGLGRGNSRQAASGLIRRVHCPLWTAPYKIAPGMVSYLRENVRSFDVVHIHALFSFAPTVAAWSCQAYGVPYIIRPLGTLANYGLTARRKALKRLSIRCVEARHLERAAAVHFTAQMEFDEAVQLGIPMRGVVIPIGVAASVNTAPAIDLRLDHPVLQGRRIVLYLSRIDPKKNIETLIDAFASSERLRAHSALVVAGSGEPAYVASLRERAARQGLGDLVVWLGHVDGDRKVAAFAAADIYCLPSFSENFGIAAVEAMLAGLPVVLGAGVAIAADVEAADAGLAVAPEAAAVGSALEQLTSDAEQAKLMGQEARRLAVAEYSISAMSRRLISLYEEICGKSHRTQADSIVAGGIGRVG